MSLLDGHFTRARNRDCLHVDVPVLRGRGCKRVTALVWIVEPQHCRFVVHRLAGVANGTSAAALFAPGLAEILRQPVAVVVTDISPVAVGVVTAGGLKYVHQRFANVTVIKD